MIQKWGKENKDILFSAGYYQRWIIDMYGTIMIMLIALFLHFLAKICPRVRTNENCQCMQSSSQVLNNSSLLQMWRQYISPLFLSNWHVSWPVCDPTVIHVYLYWENWWWGTGEINLFWRMEVLKLFVLINILLPFKISSLASRALSPCTF